MLLVCFYISGLYQYIDTKCVQGCGGQKNRWFQNGVFFDRVEELASLPLLRGNARSVLMKQSMVLRRRWIAASLPSFTNKTGEGLAMTKKLYEHHQYWL